MRLYFIACAMPEGSFDWFIVAPNLEEAKRHWLEIEMVKGFALEARDIDAVFEVQCAMLCADAPAGPLEWNVDGHIRQIQ